MSAAGFRASGRFPFASGLSGERRSLLDRKMLGEKASCTEALTGKHAWEIGQVISIRSPTGLVIELLRDVANRVCVLVDVIQLDSATGQPAGDRAYEPVFVIGRDVNQHVHMRVGTVRLGFDAPDAGRRVAVPASLYSGLVAQFGEQVSHGSMVASRLGIERERHSLGEWDAKPLSLMSSLISQSALLASQTLIGFAPIHAKTVVE